MIVRVTLTRAPHGWMVGVDQGTHHAPALGPFATLWEAAQVAAGLEPPVAGADTAVADAVTPGRTPRFG